MGHPERESHPKVKKLLASMLEEQGNRFCADCNDKQPTWASTNIGVFVCLRCSGIHRNLGVHISKVKSTSLDKWPLELAEAMREKGGNVKVNAEYEATMPEGRKPKPSDSVYVVENFIRDKYERKAWYKQGGKSSKSKGKSSKKSSKKVESSESSSEGSDDERDSESDDRPRASAKKSAAVSRKKVSDDEREERTPESSDSEDRRAAAKRASAKSKSTKASASSSGASKKASSAKSSSKKVDTTSDDDNTNDDFIADFNKVSVSNSKPNAPKPAQRAAPIETNIFDSPAAPDNGRRMSSGSASFDDFFADRSQPSHPHAPAGGHGHPNGHPAHAGAPAQQQRHAPPPQQNRPDSTASIMALFSNPMAGPSPYGQHPHGHGHANPYPPAYGMPPAHYPPPAAPYGYPPAPAPYGMQPPPAAYGSAPAYGRQGPPPAAAPYAPRYPDLQPQPNRAPPQQSNGNTDFFNF